jgi:death on curing protein
VSTPDDWQFLDRDTVLGLHRLSLEMYGGLDGFRDEGGFESALNAAEHVAYYGRGDVYQIAAAYAYHLAESQAFLDGNKRTAVATAATFLLSHGCRDASEDTVMHQAMLAIARGELNKAGLADLFRLQFPPNT